MMWVAAGIIAISVVLPFLQRSGIFGKLLAHKHIALVVAHPDDEAMFFWPTLSQLRAAGVTISVLCLSTGNFDGLGDIRKREMEKSCMQIGVTGEDLQILDDPKLQDGWQKWPSSHVAHKALRFLVESKASALLTFDERGVSGHPNHISASEGVLEAWQLAQKQSDLPPFELFMLQSVPFYRKYLGPFGSLFPSGNCDAEAVSGNPFASLKALSAHWSQLVWYRILFALASHYGYANSYVSYGFNKKLPKEMETKQK